LVILNKIPRYQYPGIFPDFFLLFEHFFQEIKNSKSKTRNQKPEIENPKSKTRNRKPEIENPKSEFDQKKSKFWSAIQMLVNILTFGQKI